MLESILIKDIKTTYLHSDNLLAMDISILYDTANEFLLPLGMNDIPTTRGIVDSAYANMSERTGFDAPENMRKIILPSIIYLRGARIPIAVTLENLRLTQKFVWDILNGARKVLKEG